MYDLQSAQAERDRRADDEKHSRVEAKDGVAYQPDPYHERIDLLAKSLEPRTFFFNTALLAVELSDHAGNCAVLRLEASQQKANACD